MTNKINLDNILTTNDTEQEISINDQLRLKVIDNLLDTDKNKKINSRLNKAQVHALTKLYLFADKYNNTFTSQLADNILLLNISLGGLGRKELVRILQTSQEQEIELQTKNITKEVFR